MAVPRIGSRLIPWGNRAPPRRAGRPEHLSDADEDYSVPTSPCWRGRCVQSAGRSAAVRPRCLRPSDRAVSGARRSNSLSIVSRSRIAAKLNRQLHSRKSPRKRFEDTRTPPATHSSLSPRLLKREHIIAAARVVVAATIGARPRRGVATEGERLTFVTPSPVVLLIPANGDTVGQDIIAAEKVVMDATSSARPRRGVAREGERLTFVTPSPVVLLIPANRDVLDQDIIAAARVVVAATSSASPQRGKAREGEHLTFIAPSPVVLGSHRLTLSIRGHPGRAAWQDPLRVDQGASARVRSAERTEALSDSTARRIF
jgi:hypothetical protein